MPAFISYYSLYSIFPCTRIQVYYSCVGIILAIPIFGCFVYSNGEFARIYSQKQPCQKII